jgi:hypothetical protein
LFIVLATKKILYFTVTPHARASLGRLRTGWQENPTELKHRNNSLNNLPIETQTSNYAKHDFETGHYEGIKSLLRDVSRKRSLISTRCLFVNGVDDNASSEQSF